MRKTLSAIFIIFLLCSPQTLYAFEKNKVAVLDFLVQGDKESQKDLGKIVSEWLTTDLVKTGRFDLVERRLLDKILSEQKLEMTGLVHAPEISVIGSLLQAQSVITGTVNILGQRILLNVRIVDVKKGTIICAEQSEATSMELEEATHRLAGLIIEHFPLRGYVVDRNADRVMVDLGLNQGIEEGEVFEVFQDGKVIKHPKTGEVLDQEQIDKGSIVVTVVRKNLAEAQIVREESGRAIQNGDRVKRHLEEGLGGAVLLSGSWEAFHSQDTLSSAHSGAGNSRLWQYQINSIGEDTYAGVNYATNTFSIQGKTLLIDLESQSGRAIWVILLSFMDGYSSTADDDSWVPGEILIPLVKGRQILTINPDRLRVPEWWIEENRVKQKVVFNQGKVLGLDLDANTDEEDIPISDTVTIYGIYLK